MAKKPPKFRKKKPKTKALADTSMSQLGIELSKELPTYDVPLDLIEPNDWNVNEMKDETFNRLVQEIEETGFISPIQIAPAKGGRFTIIGGENRWHAVKTLGRDTIPANVLTDDRFVTGKLRKLIGARLNIIQGKTNPEKFMKLYAEMAEEYGEEQLQALFGFTETDAWNKLTKGVEKSVEKIGGKKLAKEFKKKSRKVSTVDGLGNALNSLFKKHGNDLKHSYIVFAFGGQEHLYIVGSKRTMKALDEIKEICRQHGLDINDVIGPAIESIPARIAESKKSK